MTINGIRHEENEQSLDHQSIRILAEFYPNTLYHIGKKYQIGLSPFRIALFENNIELQSEDLHILKALVADYWANKQAVVEYNLPLPKNI